MKVAYFGSHMGILYPKFADSCIRFVFAVMPFLTSLIPKD